ncbi:glycosyltransferase family 2 protein [Psychroflexus tropicus]|uniref:glycosyltransferase family 2 protein n=1 Tax=Psychroflexus tropicus TaxID=197345 RepID=UPI00036606CF|nr:glycosyltransferase family 2 protein [Psychroflexus tropicus]
MQGFSIIIPTLNRTKYLLNTLKDLVVQDYKDEFEIIIVDQSKQKDEEVIDFSIKHESVKYHFVQHFKGLPEARNYGAKLANYEYLLFLDDDISCGKNLLSEHLESFINNNVGIGAGGITEKNKQNINCKIGNFSFVTATPTRGFHSKNSKEVFHAGGGNFSVKKSIYFEVGGIDEQLTKGAALYEETDFCLRVRKAGYKIWFNYDAHVFHLAAKTGGCRVPEIDKYIFSLSRNRSLIIKRHLPWYNQMTAKLFLLKLVLAYIKAYKSKSIWQSYLSGKKEGQKLNPKDIKNEQFA